MTVPPLAGPGLDGRAHRDGRRRLWCCCSWAASEPRPWLSRFVESEIDEITAEIVRLENIDPRIAYSVMRSSTPFRSAADLDPRGRRDLRADLLETSLGRSVPEASWIVCPPRCGQTFDFLQQPYARQVMRCCPGSTRRPWRLVLASAARHASADPRRAARGDPG